MVSCSVHLCQSFELWQRFENNKGLRNIALVNQILSLKKENPKADTSELENEIDELVYKLYELTSEEIAVVKNS